MNQENTDRIIEDATQKAKMLYNRALAALTSGLRENMDEWQPHREEYCVKSNMYRGFYSPMLDDLITGGIHRGKKLKRLTKHAKPTHRYAFDGNGTLRYVETLKDGIVLYTEYLMHENEQVYGITVLPDGSVYMVSEEVYHHGKLMSVFWVYMHNDGTDVRFHFGCKEIFSYDSQGLQFCSIYDFVLSAPIVRLRRYRFERENGFLTHYREVDEMGVDKGLYSYKVRTSCQL